MYNYTDHLGNIRLSYGYDPKAEQLKILEENHYYPFGLKHTNYSNYRKKYSLEEVLANEQNSNWQNLPSTQAKQTVLRIKQIITGESVAYNYKYNGKELQDELGLNWDSFKYRNYDYAIGRFMSIDPLCEKYNWQTPYSFSSNQVVHAPELEGLESSLDFGLELEKKRYESGEVSYEDHRAMQKAGGIGAVVGALFGVVAVTAPEIAEFVAVKVLKRAVQKEDGASSKYEPIKNESRGKEGVTNKETDVKKADFEKNLEKEGFEKSTSKDGKATTYTKDGKSYTTRTDAKGKDAADFRKDATVPKPDVKIRLGR